MNDSEAWLELSTLYLNDFDYSKAAYCVEELILAHPRDHLYHQLYAEVNFGIAICVRTMFPIILSLSDQVFAGRSR